MKTKALEIMWRIMIFENYLNGDKETFFEYVEELTVWPISTEFCTVYDLDGGWYLYRASGGVITTVTEGGSIMPSPKTIAKIEKEEE